MRIRRGFAVLTGHFPHIGAHSAIYTIPISLTPRS